MSTRAVITVIDGEDKFSIYRHHDGYPDGAGGVLMTLGLAIPLAWPLPRFEAADFAAAIVAAWKRPGGGDIYFTPNRDVHGDLAYAYEIRQITNARKGVVGSLQVDVFTPKDRACDDGSLACIWTQVSIYDLLAEMVKAA